MIENIKSGVLTVLVLLSIVLSWQLWTFQPDYGYLEQDEYLVNTPVGQIKGVADVIKPDLMVLHHQSQPYLLYPNKPNFNEFYKELKQITFSDYDYLTNNEILMLPKKEKNGIEVIFPSAVPTELFNEVFHFELSSYDINSVNRLEIFVDQQVSNRFVLVRVISYEDEKVVQAISNLSIDIFRNNFMADANELPEAFSYLVPSKDIIKLVPSIYLPKEPVQMEQLTYTSTFLSPDNFKFALFSDPSYAKYYRQSESQESYTDGNRMLNVLYSGNILFYINPIYSDSQDNSRKNVIASGIDFINGHSGWTDNFTFYDWNPSKIKEEALFRLHVGGIPVFSSDHENVVELYISRIGNQIYEYIRPLFDLDDQPIDVSTSVTLPSGEEIIQEVKSRTDFDKLLLQDIVIAYKMNKTNSIVTFYPEWYVKYNGKWEVVKVGDDKDKEEPTEEKTNSVDDKEDSGADQNGLE